VVYVGSYDHTVYAVGSLQSMEPTAPSSTDWRLLIAISLFAIAVAVVAFVVVLYRRKHEA
jgi:hypothetical protein